MPMKNMKSLGARFANGDKAKSGVDADAVRELAELLTETGLTEIEIEHNGARIRVSRAAVNAVMEQPGTEKNRSQREGGNNAERKII